MSVIKQEWHKSFFLKGRRTCLLRVSLIFALVIFAASSFFLLSGLFFDNAGPGTVRLLSLLLVMSGSIALLVFFLREKEAARLARQQKTEALNMLAIGVAHDFNNLLSCFETYATFLHEDLEPETKQHGYASQILKTNERSRKIIADICENPEMYEEQE